jgi:hypothetical protein
MENPLLVGHSTTVRAGGGVVIGSGGGVEAIVPAHKKETAQYTHQYPQFSRNFHAMFTHPYSNVHASVHAMFTHPYSTVHASVHAIFTQVSRKFHETLKRESTSHLFVSNAMITANDTLNIKNNF